VYLKEFPTEPKTEEVASSTEEVVEE